MLEDDSEDRYLTESIFKEIGYNVRLEFLTHGPEVIRHLQQCEEKGGGYPDLILLDKNVPTGSGMEVLKELKTNARYKTIPVVMISGSDAPRNPRKPRDPSDMMKPANTLTVIWPARTLANSRTDRLIGRMK